MEINRNTGRVTIANDATDTIKGDRNLFFGLGLKLTAQLTEKLNWFYTKKIEPERHRAEICFDWIERTENLNGSAGIGKQPV